MRLGKFLAVLSAALAVGTAFAQTEPGSFINHVCANTPALVKHAQSDRSVMDRYMRHFAMTEAEVVSYLSSLKVTTATKDELYVVYGAPNGGPLRSRLMHVKRGTKVYVDESGQVVLLWHCGNPVTRGPKTPLDVSRPLANPAGTPDEGFRPVPLQAPVATMEANIITSSEPIVPEVPIVPEQNSNIPIVTTPSTSSLLGILPILGLIHTSGNANPPVPEPATIGIIGLGVAGVISRRRKSKS